VQRSGQPDVYQYEIIPENVINQVIMILGDAIGNFEKIWDVTINTLAREYSDPSILLCSKYHRLTLDSRGSCEEFLTTQLDIDRKLDLIELSFRLIKLYTKYTNGADAAVFELNYRLREGGVGYQFENGIIIRMDSQFVHAEITKKALSLLSCQSFGPYQGA
jgi:hypothetical protein